MFFFVFFLCLFLFQKLMCQIYNKSVNWRVEQVIISKEAMRVEINVHHNIGCNQWQV